jgi:hypothetical protein
MTFKQHVPPMVTTDAAPIEFDFETRDELLANDWIAEWKRDGSDFYRYSLAAYDPVNNLVNLLMYEHDGGRKWWVLGYIRPTRPDEKVEALGLPEWKPPDEV